MSEASPGMKLVKTPAKAPPKAAPAKPQASKPADPTAAIAGVVAKATAPAGAKVAAPAAPKVAAKAAPKAPVLATKEAPAATATTNAVETETANSATDLIVQTAHQIENLSEEKAFKQVPALLDDIDQNSFKLGGVLSLIQANGWFMNKGYENFRAYVEAECAIEYRKAMYLIAIYNGLVESGVPWSEVGHLGWTKLKELASILDQDNVKDWVAVAENMTVLQLIEHIKQSKQAGSAQASDAAPVAPSTLTTLTFKLHTDQKKTVREAIDKCKSLMNTEFDAVAIEHICLDYLAGDGKAKALPTLSALMKGKSAEEVLEAFGQVFPEVELSATVPE